MIVLNALEALAGGLILQRHSAWEATFTAAAETAQDFDTVQGGDQMPLDASRVQGFTALQATIHIHQHRLQGFQVEAAQTVAQGVIPEGALGANPVLQVRVGQFGISLLETGEAEDKSVEKGEEDAAGGDVRVGARVRHLRGVRAQTETLVQVGGERG